MQNEITCAPNVISSILMQASRAEFSSEHLVIVSPCVSLNHFAECGKDLLPRIITRQREIVASYYQFHLSIRSKTVSAFTFSAPGFILSTGSLLDNFSSMKSAAACTKGRKKSSGVSANGRCSLKAVSIVLQINTSIELFGTLARHAARSWPEESENWPRLLQERIAEFRNHSIQSYCIPKHLSLEHAQLVHFQFARMGSDECPLNSKWSSKLPCLFSNFRRT